MKSLFRTGLILLLAACTQKQPAQNPANLEAPESGVYTFSLMAPGIARLTLDGAPVIEIAGGAGGAG